MLKTLKRKLSILKAIVSTSIVTALLLGCSQSASSGDITYHENEPTRYSDTEDKDII